MKFYLAILLLAFAPCIIATAFSNPQQCASFSDAGIPGYFAMYNPGNGLAYYYFNIDMSLIPASTCAVSSSSGYTYHIHTSWTNDPLSSQINCGPSYTGYHYDPTLACSSTSAYQHMPFNCGSTNPAKASTACCVTMGRIAGNYSYTCSPAVYEAGDYSSCEVGDLSGKFGPSIPSSSGFITPDKGAVLVDRMPYNNENYQTSTKNAAMWTSLVIHCQDGGARVLCAKFSPNSANLQSCSSGFTAIDNYIKTTCPTNDDDSTASGATDNDDASKDVQLSGAIAAAVIFGVLFAVLTAYTVYERSKGDFGKSMSSQEKNSGTGKL